jgi:hypothetical protein
MRQTSMRIENNLQNEEPHKDKGRQQVCHLEWVSLRGSSPHLGYCIVFREVVGFGTTGRN